MTLISNYTKKAKTTIGGLSKIYLTKFVDYDETEIMSSGMKLTVFPSTYFYEFDCIGNYDQSQSVESGQSSWAPKIQLKLSKVYDEININIFAETDFRAIAKTNNDQYIMLGTMNGLEATLTNSSGAGREDFNGFDLTFKGKEEKAGLLIDDLNTVGIYIINDDTFNYEFNFNI